MKKALDIRFLGMEPSAAVESAAREKARKLEQFCTDLTSCRVSIDAEHRHKHQGHPYAVRIDLSFPGHQLNVDRVQHEDVYVALRDAFDAMKRQLEETVLRSRGNLKQHPVPLHGEVARFDADGRCGFIRCSDGNEYWFGPENMAGTPFEHLGLGAAVQFIAEVAAEGRQAKRVSLGKHNFE